MNSIDNRIIKFIKKNHILSIATTENNSSWSANLFYAFDEKNIRFIITSDIKTKHGNMILHNNIVSGCIALKTRIFTKIQGIQFYGKAEILSEKDIEQAKTIFYKKFPIALLFSNKIMLWEIKPKYIKYTNNNLGFGKKIIWKNNSI